MARRAKGKRQPREGTFFQRANGRWEGRVLIGYVNGAPKYKSVIRADRAEAYAAWLELKRQAAQGAVVTTARQTLAQFLERWLTDVVAQRCRPATQQMYRTLVGYVAPHIGHLQLTQLSAQHIQSMLTTLRREGRAPRTIAHTRELLINALGTAERWQLVPRNVAKLTEPVRVDAYHPCVLSQQEAQHFLDTAAHHRLGALFHLALSLGLRRGEVLGLRWQDLDLDAGMLHVRVSLQEIKGQLRLVQPKTQHSVRTLPLAPLHIAALRRHKAQQLQERLRAGSRWQEHGLVFPSRWGTPMAPTALYHVFRALLLEAGLPPMRFHDLRHSCASFLVALGVSPKVAQDVLGHSDVGITLRIYTHVTDAQKQAATAALAELITTPETREVG